MRLTRNTVVALTGGLGSGKTLLAVKLACIKWRFNDYVYWFDKWVRYPFRNWKNKIIFKAEPKKMYERPLLYCNIPLNHKAYRKLTREMLLNKKLRREYSTTVVDELGQFASQYDFKNPNVMDNLQKLIRFERHVINGNFIYTDQNSSNIVVPVRRRSNVSYNLSMDNKFFLLKFITFGLVKLFKMEITQISHLEDLMTVEQSDVGMRDKHYQWVLLLGYKKVYESRCYRYIFEGTDIDSDDPGRATNLYTNEFIDLEPTQEELLERGIDPKKICKSKI